jgi:glycosyltransferase involved in cell wall biosynthesis
MASVPRSELLLVGRTTGPGRPWRHHTGVRHVRLPSQNRLAELYRSADVCVMPSDIDDSCESVVKAMASGLPVIVAGRAMGITSGVDGFQVPARDAEAIAAALRTLDLSPGRRVRVGRAARATAEDLTWRAFADRVRTAAAVLCEAR